MEIYIPFLLPFLSVILGYSVAVFAKPKDRKYLKLLMAFSGSFLLSLTVLHLLPEVYNTPILSHHETHGHENHSIGIFIMVGILFQIVLEFFSKGAEHGHVHGHQKMSHIPWLLFISLCIHALLEGFPVSKENELALGISIHHFPIAVILTTFFYDSSLKKSAIFGFMATFAVMTPLGTALAEYLPMLQQFSTEITAIVIGILFHISSTIIFESNEGHKFNVAKVSMIALGLAVAYFI